MKRVFRLAAIVAGLAAAAWLVKDRLLPAPQPPSVAPPAFRSPTPRAPSGTPPTPASPVPATPAPGAPDDLTAVKGIGPVYAARLTAQGITTFAALARSDVAAIAERTGVSEDQARSWVEQAARHAG